MSDAVSAAEDCLARARVHRSRGDHARAQTQIEIGLDLVRGAGSEVEVALLLERARLASWHWDGGAVSTALEAAAAARAARSHLAEAEHHLALALWIEHSPQCLPRLRVARRHARREGALELELESASQLAAAAHMFGDARRARAVATVVARRAAAGKRVYEADALYVATRMRLYADGELEPAASELAALLDHPGIGSQRAQVAADVAVALADAGRAGDARRYLQRAGRYVQNDWVRCAVVWAAAEVELASGRPERALARIDDALAVDLNEYVRLEIDCTRRWALYDLGLPPSDRARALGDAHTRTIRIESEAFAALAAGQLRRARRLFVAAAEQWRGQQLRSELRALRAAAAAAARAGDRRAGRELLEHVEQEAQRLGHAAILARTRQDLETLLSRRRRPQRSRPQLSPREHEILRLVAAGLSTPAIAERTGLARSTIETHVRGAIGKLGARTRLEAAARVVEAPLVLAPDPEEAPLVELLLAGESVTNAARLLAISRRTAVRRLEALRRRTGSATNAQAVASAAAALRSAQRGPAD